VNVLTDSETVITKSSSQISKILNLNMVENEHVFMLVLF
jgi:hypothetical protein